MLRSIALLTLTAFVLAGQADAAQPNIVYILLDDAGYGDLSCYGQQKFKTPNIDRIAAEGMKFTDHYSGSTVCAPTRCSLLTGLHTGHTFVRGNREVKPEGQAAMPAEIITIPRLLRDAGYKTGAFGKWGLGSPGSTSDPVEHFDEFYGYNCQREAHNYYPDHLWHNAERVPMDGKTYSATLIHEQAIGFIRDNKDGPFFAFLPTPIPHAAMHAPEEFNQPFRKKFAQFEDTIGKYSGPEVKNPIAAFAGMMTLVDQQVGEVLDVLEELGIADNTLVMLTSDNGPHKEGGHDPVFFDSNGPLQGFKRDLYEGGIRAPLLARWPGTIKPGTVSDHVSAHWDMLPTFCALAGVKVPAKTDGISMVPTLMSDPQNQPAHQYLYWEFYERGGKRAVRFGDWKAVQLNLNKDPNAPIQLYHLPSDVAESNDVAAKHPKLVEKAKSFFKDAHVPSQFWKFGRPQKKQKNAKQKSAA
ncbi:arylsulfatase [Planctomycetes bacterium K23_9]|uniref:Arylsulfatase n=1 Tax=Stieleria marina TaxID=1930275 RepID=A0A517NP88_9BACT|nr:Arylsulfatase [Planctomycetes bacterium K23_9]